MLHAGAASLPRFGLGAPTAAFGDSLAVVNIGG